MISIQHWDNSTNPAARRRWIGFPAASKDVAADDVWWIDLGDPTPEEEERVFGRFFPVHTLTLRGHHPPRHAPGHGAHLPKVEEFPDYLFVIVNPLPAGLAEVLKTHSEGDALPHSGDDAGPPKYRPQLSAVLNQRVLITHHYQPLECVDDGADLRRSPRRRRPPRARTSSSTTSSTRW